MYLPKREIVFGEEVGFMSKHTSKSVSASKQISSRSGTCAKTVRTAKTPSGSRFALLSKRVNSKNSRQVQATLKRAGILTKDGKLSAQYQ